MYRLITALFIAALAACATTHPLSLPSARRPLSRWLQIATSALLCLGISGCGGTKLLRNPEPMVLAEPLATNTDSKLEARLDWVIFRAGPGSWAKNADWDEYLLHVKNRSGGPVSIINVVAYDSMNEPQKSTRYRAELVKASKKTKKRYKGHDITVKAGVSGEALAMAGGAAFAGSTAIAISAFQGSSTAIAASGAAVVALAAAPVLLVSGIVRGANNHVVARAIERRHTLFPLRLEAGGERNLDVFFPITPSPQRIEVNYFDSKSKNVLVIDTASALEGLHIGTR